jgi:hypothetical protein
MGDPARQQCTERLEPRPAVPPTAVRPYLFVEQLASLTPWSVDAIEKMVRRGPLVRGIHYFQPTGKRGRLIFKWTAIVALIEGLPVHSEPELVVDEPRPPALRSVPARAIDVEKATTDLQRLLS